MLVLNYTIYKNSVSKNLEYGIIKRNDTSTFNP